VRQKPPKTSAVRVAPRSGLTLVEILIALALIGISSLMFAYFSSAFRITRSAQIDTQALNLARSYLDTLRASVAAGAPLPQKPQLKGYEFEGTIVTVEATNNKLSKVTVRVKGPGGSGQEFVTQVVTRPQ
jgi:prepilin-type N-terminal cleavage/methylation domain-containing protein